MRSKTSFFNHTLFWKDVSRFWPVWGGYFAIWFLLGPLVLLGQRADFRAEPILTANYVLNLGYIGGVIMGGVFALLAAMAAWSFVCRARSAQAVACLPVRREGVFLSLGMAGLLPLLAMNVLTTVLLFLTEALIGCVDWPGLGQFLALSSLPLVFYFGFAVFCAQLTGNILVLPALYALLNFVVPAVELLLRAIGGMFMFGMDQNLYAFSLLWFSPPITMFRYGGVGGGTTTYNDITGQVIVSRATVTGWGMLCVYAAVGVLLFALALLLYRRRRMESAGDVVAVNVLKPVFRWCMALGCAVGLGLLLFVVITQEYSDNMSMGQMPALLLLTLFMLIGAFVGWFVAQMLIQKSFRVWRGHWAGCGLCCLVIVAAMFAMEFDLVGFERRVPNAEKVENVQLIVGGERVMLREAQNLAAATALHRSIIEGKAQFERDPGDSWLDLKLVYNLRGGRSMFRNYTLRYDAETGAASAAQALINCPEAIAERKETPFPLNNDTVAGGRITAPIYAGEGAKLGGYDSTEDWILAEVHGYSAKELAQMDEEDRKNEVANAVYYLSRDPEQYQLEAASTPGVAMAAVTELGFDPAAYVDIKDIDLDKVLFDHTWSFTPRELVELYETCILPDMDDGTIGRLYILQDGAYYKEVTGITIDIEASMEQETAAGEEAYDTGDGRQYYYFSTRPTLESKRTNAWLEAHGIPVRSLEEMMGK